MLKQTLAAVVATAPLVAAAPLETKAAPTYLECRSCTSIEKLALKRFQDRGIRDKAALATLLGNIKQESLWKPDVCEGGARTGYHRCKRGGFGLIQWTWSSRYTGLGRHANKLGLSPNSAEAQLSYIFTEREWRKAEPGFKRNGNSIRGYMNHAKTWLGWGIEGKRATYAHQYYNKLG